MSVWKRPRAARAGESDRAKHYTYVVRWRYGGTRDGDWQNVTVGHTRGHKRVADELDERVAAAGYAVTAETVRGWLTSDEPATETTAPTVADLVTAWAERPKLSAGSRKVYRTHLAKLGDLGQLRADRLTRTHVNKWFSALEASGLKEGSLSSLANTLRGATRGHVDPAVFRDVKYSPKEREVTPVYLTNEQVNDLRAAAHGTALWLPVWAMAELGLRYAEMAGLRAKDIDHDRREVTVRVQLPQTVKRYHGFAPTRPKTPNSRRTIPMSRDLADALAVMRNLPADAPVFAPAHDDFWVYSGWLKMWRKLVARVPSVPDDLRVHDLRHSCAMRWLRGGEDGIAVPLGLVSKLLGHSSIAVTTEMYTHWDDRDTAVILSAGLSTATR